MPIKTYHWEDVRKSRRKGGYPWTYLDRPPFEEEPHPEHYTMEEFRRSRSSSTLGKTDVLEIQELPNGSSSDHGSVEPIISEATTPEPPRIKRTRDSSIVTLESAGSSDNLSQYLDKDEKDRDEKYRDENVSTAQPNVGVTNDEKENVKSTNEEQPGQLDTNGRSDRAKSEEPKRKRKLSIESSYSRISLSKLGVLKKLRDAKEKMKVPKLSFRRKLPKKKAEEKDQNKEDKPPEKAKNTTKSQLKSTNPDKPVYIHIPLKPPPGETDEFSYLEFGEQPNQPSTSKEPDQPQSTPDSPAAGASGVQFIVLTPPSDDEILEDAHIPDTPSSGEKFFDNVRIEDLKTLAKDVVDGMEARRKKLATVEEDKENGSAADTPDEASQDEQLKSTEEKSEKIEDTAEKIEDEVEKISIGARKESNKIENREEKMIIDEEDGLRSSEIIQTEASQEVSSVDNKSENASPSTSQVAEKRRSFRKKAKKEDADRIYEDVQVPQAKSNAEARLEKPANLQPSDISQSMSVDEEKTYLDEKIIKTTSLEEDYNKWSKTK